MEIFLLILGLAIALFIAIFCIIRKTFFTKSNYVFFLPIMVLLSAYNVYGAYLAGNLNVPGFLNCLAVSLKCFAFSVDTVQVRGLIGANSFTVGYYLAVVMASFTTVSVCVGLIFIRTVNWIRLFWRKRRGLDVVIGDGEKARTYLHNNPRAAVWLPGRADSYKIKELSDRRIAFIERAFTAGNFIRIARGARHIDFIAFGDDYERQLDVIITYGKALEKAKPKSSVFRTSLYAEIERDNLDSVQSFFTPKTELVRRLFCFSYYEYVAVDLFQRHPLTRYLGFTDPKTGLVLPETKIDVHMIGFGRINSEILKSSVAVHQLATSVDGQKLTPAVISYHVYDRQRTRESDKNRVHNYLRYRRFLDDPELDRSQYFALPDPTHEFEFREADINNLDIGEKIASLARDRLKDEQNKEASFVFISFGSDLDNIDYARRTILRLREEGLLDDPRFRLHIFARVKSAFMRRNFPLPGSLVTYYGCDEEVLTHDVVVNEALFAMAKAADKTYAKASGYESDWELLTPFAKRSNLYEAMGVRVKLNLVGLDLYSSAYTGEHKSFAVLLGSKSYGYDSDYDPDDSEPLTIRKVMTYIEHLRWNAYHIVNGYLPMKIADAKVVDGRVVTKSSDRRTHLCLTTYRDLDRVADLCACLSSGVTLRSIGPEDELYGVKLEAETYQYDMLNVDIVDEQIEAGGQVIGELETE